MHDPFLLRDVIQLAMMVFAVGAFVNEARSTKKLVDKQAASMAAIDSRMVEVEKVQNRQNIVLDRAVSMLDKLDGKFDHHITTSKCGEHAAQISAFQVEMRGIHGEVERLRDRVDSVEQRGNE